MMIGTYRRVKKEWNVSTLGTYAHVTGTEYKNCFIEIDDNLNKWRDVKWSIWNTCVRSKGQNNKTFFSFNRMSHETRSICIVSRLIESLIKEQPVRSGWLSYWYDWRCYRLSWQSADGKLTVASWKINDTVTCCGLVTFGNKYHVYTENITFALDRTK